jgi:hypothetical protein
MEDGMIIVSGEVRFGPGEIDRLRPAMRKAIEARAAKRGARATAMRSTSRSGPASHLGAVAGPGGARRPHEEPHLLEFIGLVREAKVEAMSVRMYEGAFAGTLLED